MNNFNNKETKKEYIQNLKKSNFYINNAKDKIKILFCESKESVITECMDILNSINYIKADAIYHKFDITEEEYNKYLSILKDIFKNKGKELTEDDADRILSNNVSVGCLKVINKEYDSIIGGKTLETAKFIGPVLSLLKKNRSDFVSSFMILKKHEEILFLSDIALNIYLNSEQLAECTKQTIESFKLLIPDVNPYAALLSYTSKKVSKDKNVITIQEAVKLLRATKYKDYIDGEIQFDAAYSLKISNDKNISRVQNIPANIFIFPSLFSANIGYKIAQYLGKYSAYGPFLQNLEYICSDLSRGSNIKDICNTALIICKMIYIKRNK